MGQNSHNSRDLLQTHEAHLRAWNDFDLGALGEIFDDECIIYDTIPPRRFHGLREFIEHLFPLLQTYSRLKLRTYDRLTGVEVHHDGGVGWIACCYELEARLKDGVHRRRGRWTEIYQKKNGRWKLVHFHTSADPSTS